MPDRTFGKVEKCISEIEKVYTGLVNALQSAASATIPLKKRNIEKCWWDAELSNLKTLSVITHKA